MAPLAYNLQTSLRPTARRRPTLSMRVALFLVLLAGLSRLSAADLTVVRVWPGYRTATSFDRISEFFDGKENTGGQTYLRTQPAVRDGYYFLLRIKNGAPSAFENAAVELNIITPDSATPKKITAFPTFTIPKGNHVFQIGLTGSDWPDTTISPVAWQLRLLSPDGQELLSEQSLLWSKPPK